MGLTHRVFREVRAVLPLGQKIMLAMSEEDLQAGRTIDQITLNERELEWLKESTFSKD